jgi:hypothetical protein
MANGAAEETRPIVLEAIAIIKLDMTFARASACIVARLNSKKHSWMNAQPIVCRRLRFSFAPAKGNRRHG